MVWVIMDGETRMSNLSSGSGSEVEVLSNVRGEGEVNETSVSKLQDDG